MKAGASEIVLVPMTGVEFAAYRNIAGPAHARDQVEAGEWPSDGALERAERTFDAMLPQGLQTPDHLLWTIKAQRSGLVVGALWCAIQTRAEKRIAFVFDIVIEAQHRRRGYGTSALDALEKLALERGLSGIALHVFGQNVDAARLYSRLGYATTHISMFRSLAMRN